ncbi:hypothetical protein [Streptomyces sp. T12]|uniref:hypothetical protein n=1 Tax=Streptomyces sp. T12 TaxID=477697 RepID=UPI0016486B37|nr:hypothetical protein [Streptomyces sp. T12]
MRSAVIFSANEQSRRPSTMIASIASRGEDVPLPSSSRPQVLQSAAVKRARPRSEELALSLCHPDSWSMCAARSAGVMPGQSAVARRSQGT